MSVSHRQDDPEKDRFISGTTAVLLCCCAVLAVAAAVAVMAALRGGNEPRADDRWRSPMLTFGSQEMPGSAAADAIRSFEGCSVEIAVETSDGCAATYNYDSKKGEFLPTYAGTDAGGYGYINPSGVFAVEGISDGDGRVYKVVLKQK